MFRILFVLSFYCLILLPHFSFALEINGKVGITNLWFQNPPLDPAQHQQQTSILADVEIYQAWNNDQDSVLFKPYVRLDQYDAARSRGDIRELVWQHLGEDWELRAGISKVFWGVNEGNNLVDIINQDDQADNLNGDEKLGQAMINLSLIRDWGTLDFFILPGFRPRTFPGKGGRLRPLFDIDYKNPSYESRRGNKNIDYAIRWSDSIGDFDLGLHYFVGTNRDPRYLIQKINTIQLLSSPYYDQISQLGLDVQATLDAWLLKLEMIKRKDQFDNFLALSGGFEYTFNAIMDSNMDLGIIAEYSWDQRLDPLLSFFQNDILLAARLGFNDAQSSEFVVGFLQDVDYSQLRSFQIEASTRLGDDTKISIDLQIFEDYIFNPISYDDYIQLSIEKYF